MGFFSPILDWFGDLFGSIFSTLGTVVMGILTHTLNPIINAVFTIFFSFVLRALSVAEQKLIEETINFFVKTDAPTSMIRDSGDNNSPVGFLISHLYFISILLAISGILFSCIRIAIQQSYQALQTIIFGLFNYIVVAGASVSIAVLLLQLGDDYTGWIMHDATHVANDSFGKMFTASITFGNFAVDLLDVFVYLIVFFAVIIACVIQFLTMVCHVGLLGLLMGLLPLFAAISTTHGGSIVYKKGVAWLLAFILYKPTVATIYSYAFVLMGYSNTHGNHGDTASDIANQLTGAGMIIMATLSLPALMKLVNPLVSAMETGSSSNSVFSSVVGLAASGAVMNMFGGGKAAAAGKLAGGSEAGGAGGGSPRGGGAAAAGEVLNRVGNTAQSVSDQATTGGGDQASRSSSPNPGRGRSGPSSPNPGRGRSGSSSPNPGRGRSGPSSPNPGRGRSGPSSPNPGSNDPGGFPTGRV